MREADFDNLGAIPRRAIVAAPLIGIFTFAVMLIAAADLDLPVIIPDGAVLGSPLVAIATVLVVFILLDVVPRAVYRSRRALGRVAATVKGVYHERWNAKRLAIVVAAMVGFYLTYIAYRNLKSFLPFASDANYDHPLFQLDRDMFFGHDPGTVLHNVLGTGISAQVLSAVYLFFLVFVPLSLGVAVVWQRRLHGGLWYVSSMCFAWIFGTLSYYALPSLGPIFLRPQLYSSLPTTGVSDLQQTLLQDRHEVIAAPQAGDGIQSIAAFASLHMAIVLAAVLIATLLGARRWIRVVLWVYLGLTFLSTIYFGWHYLIDDIAGAAIGALSVVLGAAATGHSLKPRGRRQLAPVMGRLVGSPGGDAAILGAGVMRRDATAERHSE